MKLKPEKWTHHHTHRLFHISMGLCFGFISIVLVGGMLSALFNVSADDNTPKSGVLNVSALVEGVNPGPITSGTIGGSKPAPTANPTITIFAVPQGYVPVESGAYIFSSNSPIFSGYTSVPNGLVFITVKGQKDLNSTVFAGQDGKWYWKSPEALPEGKYSVTVAVFDSYDLTRSGSAFARFNIKLPAVEAPSNTNSNAQTNQSDKPINSGNTSNPGSPSIPNEPELPPTEPQEPPLESGANPIFGTFVKVLQDYKKISTNNKVVVAVSLVSNSEKQINDQKIDFKVTSPKGKVILQTSDVVSFSKHSDYLKTFFIAPATPAGEYTVLVTSTYKGISSTSSDTFIVNESPAAVGEVSENNEQVVQQWPVLVWVLLFLLLFMFIILTIMAYYQVRHHNRELGSGAQS